MYRLLSKQISLNHSDGLYGEAVQARDSCEHDDVIMEISCGFIATMHVVLTIIGSPGLQLEAVRDMRKLYIKVNQKMSSTPGFWCFENISVRQFQERY